MGRITKKEEKREADKERGVIEGNFVNALHKWEKKRNTIWKNDKKEKKQ